MSKPILRHLVLALGALLMTIGGVMLVVRPTVSIPRGRDVYIGFADPGIGPAVTSVAAAVLVFVGFCAIVAWLGFRIGREAAAGARAGAARFIAPAAGAVALLVGAVLLALRPGLPGTSFGWTAYAPLSAAVYTPFPPAATLIALILIVAGVCAIVSWITFRIGRELRIPDDPGR